MKINLSIFIYYRNVSQELSELIMTMVQHCSLMLSKSTMNRPPPPGVLRHRGLEPFNPAALGSQVFLNCLLIIILFMFFKIFSNFFHYLFT